MEETENRVHNEEVAEQAGEQTTEQGGEQVVQYYSGGNFSDSPSAAAKGAKIKKPLLGWTKAIIIIPYNTAYCGKSMLRKTTACKG